MDNLQQYPIGSEVEVTLKGTIVSHSPLGRIDISMDGNKAGASLDPAIPGTTVKVVKTPDRFQKGRTYQGTLYSVGGDVQGTVKVSRTSFGKWYVHVHPNPGLVGEVLTDAWLSETTLNRLRLYS